MPLYDYECPEHGQWEEVRRMADHARAPCPSCGRQCRQIITTFPATSATTRSDWSGLNGGRGHYEPRLAGFPGDPRAYFRSKTEMRERVSRHQDSHLSTETRIDIE